MKIILILILALVMTNCSTCNKSNPPPSPTPTPSPQIGLKINPQNPHYFLDVSNNQPVMIVAYSTIAPSGSTWNLNQIDSIISKYTRVWHLLPWDPNPVWPWKKIAPRLWDMNQWDDVYWSRLTQAIAKDTSKGIVSEIMLFDRCGMSPGGNDRWGSNPWALNLNVNSLETPDSNGDGTPDFYHYATKPNLRTQQEKYVKRMIDMTSQYNVIYEVENEHWESSDPDWADHYAKFAKDYLKTKNILRLISYSSLYGDLEVLYSYPSIDIINWHQGSGAEGNPGVLNNYLEGHWSLNKAMNVDEFANGVTDTVILRKMVWEIVTSGGNFHIEDANPSSNPAQVVANVQQFLSQSGWDFIGSHPSKSASSGFCMIKDSQEYVCYFVKGGTVQLNNLPSGNYLARWWNNLAGGFQNQMTFVHGGGNKSLITPNSSDWVLQIKRQ